MIKKVLQGSFPTMIAAMMYSMYAVIDGIFVGNATGDIGLAAINIAWPLAAIIFAMGIAIGTGGSVMISFYRGKGEAQSAKDVYGTTLLLLLSGGLVLMGLFLQYENILEILGAEGEVYIEAKAYIEVFIKGSVILVFGSGIPPLLRNLEMAVHAMVLMIIGLLLNVSINYYLMYQVGMGIKGAATGTVISQLIVVTLGLCCLYKNKIFGLCVTMKIHCIKEILKSGITPMGLYLAPSVTLVFTNLQCLRYGGDPVVACYAVVAYIVFPVLAILGGVGDGNQPLISYYFGANREKEGAVVKRISYIMVMVLGVLATIISIVLSHRIGAWFGLSEASQEYFIQAMIISSFAFVGQGVTKFTSAYLNATMRCNMSMFLTFTESLVINPIMLMILPLAFGVTGIWMAPFATACTIIVTYIGQEKYTKMQ